MVMAAFGSSMVAGVGIALMMLALFTAVIVGVVRPRYGAKVAWGAVGASLSLIALVAILAS